MNHCYLFSKENVGFNVDQLYGTIHNQVSGGPGVGGNTYVKDMTNTFHTYKADWNSERIIFYVDDRAYFVSFKIQKLKSFIKIIITINVYFVNPRPVSHGVLDIWTLL